MPLRIAGTLLCAAGILTAAYGATLAFRQMRLVNAWTLVDARVLESGIVPPSPGHPARARYELWYRVGETSYTAVYESPGTVFAVRDRIAAHSPGSTDQLRCDPSHPDRIQPNLAFNSATLGRAAGFIGSGIALLLCGLALILLGRPLPQRL